MNQGDLQQIRTLLREELLPIKKDVKGIKQDTTDIKLKINEFAKTTLDMFGDLLDWTSDIHKRVKHLENIIKTS